MEHNVDILVLTETKVYSKSKIRLDGYQVFPAVRKRNGGGEMPVAVKHGLCSSVMIDEGENAEFITIRLDFGGVHFRLICIYSPQENDSIDQLDGFYEAISSQITRTCLAGDFVFLVCDFNAKLGRQFISGDIHDISGNGKRLLNIVKEFNLDVSNSSQKCTGIFTRVNNKSPDEKSVLDYVIVSSQLEKYVNYMRIDQQKLFTPWKTLKQGKRFSDHSAILLGMSLPVKMDLQVSSRKTTWNFVIHLVGINLKKCPVGILH